MSLKLTDENFLYYIMKHSVAVVVTLGHDLIIDAMMLTEKAVNSDVKIEQNLFDINDFSTSYMLLSR